MNGPGKAKNQDVFSAKTFITEIGTKTEYNCPHLLSTIQNVSALVGALAHNTTLVKLVINGSNLGKEGAYELSKLFSTNTTLVSLDLSSVFDPLAAMDHTKRDEIGSSGAVHIFKALRRNCTLKELKMADQKMCSIDTSDERKRDLKAIQLMCQILRSNNAITSLDVNSNNIGDDGVSLISEALKENHALTILHLEKNNLKKTICSSF